MIKTHWTFLLNTQDLNKATKIINRVQKTLGTSFKETKVHKYYKGDWQYNHNYPGYRLLCESECESFSDLRRKLGTICFDWRCQPYPFQGNTVNNCRITGVSWVDFWIEE